MDSDDLWGRDHVSVLIDKFMENPFVSLLFTDEYWFKNGVFTNKTKIFQYNNDRPVIERQLQRQILPVNNMLVNKIYIERFYGSQKLFDESLRYCEDFEFIKFFAEKNDVIVSERVTTVKRGGREDQLSYIYREEIRKYLS